jgi:copper(I)-binding protein
MQDNVMRMRQVPAIELPAGKTVALQPGGYHVMLMGLKHPVVEGDTVPLTLSFANRDGSRETVQVNAVVRPLNTNANTSAKPTEHKH